MKTKEKNKLYKKALCTWGESLQLSLMIEAMAKLINLTAIHLRGFDNSEVLIEEMANVSIMFERAKLVFCRYPDNKKIYEKFIDEKLKYLEEQLKRDKDND